jgi:hypothetical protein
MEFGLLSRWDRSIDRSDRPLLVVPNFPMEFGSRWDRPDPFALFSPGAHFPDGEIRIAIDRVDRSHPIALFSPGARFPRWRNSERDRSID